MCAYLTVANMLFKKSYYIRGIIEDEIIIENRKYTLLQWIIMDIIQLDCNVYLSSWIMAYLQQYSILSVSR